MERISRFRAKLVIGLFLDGVGVPNAGLYLTDMSAAQHKHSQTRLTDTAANC